MDTMAGPDSSLVDHSHDFCSSGLRSLDLAASGLLCSAQPYLLQPVQQAMPGRSAALEQQGEVVVSTERSVWRVQWTEPSRGAFGMQWPSVAASGHVNYQRQFRHRYRRVKIWGH
jgi:hypothetical protein